MAWTQKKDLGGVARYRAAAFSIGTKGYVVCGEGGGLLNDLWEYNPSTNTWAQKANFSGSVRMAPIAFVVDSRAYVGLGGSYGARFNDLYEYTPSTNTWVQKANFPGDGRVGAIAFGIGPIGYIGLGYSSVGLKKDFWRYTPASNSYTQHSDFPGVARWGAVAFVVGSKAYLGTGEIGSGRASDFWEYNPSGGVWTQKDSFAGGTRSVAAGFSDGTYGYLGTGYGDASPAGKKNDLYKFNPAAGAGSQWTKTFDFIGAAREQALGFGIGTKGYLGTGNTGSAVQKDFYEFDPATTQDVSVYLSTQWIVRKTWSPVSFLSSWNILDKYDVSDTLQISWNVQKQPVDIDAPAQLAVSWSVRGDYVKSLLSSWNIEDKFPVNDSLGIQWQVLENKNYSLLSWWDILDKQDIDSPAQLAASWNVRKEEVKSLSSSWDVAGLINTDVATLGIEWQVLGNIKEWSLLSSWNIDDKAMASNYLNISWEVGSTSDVSKTLDMSWNVAEYNVSKTLDILWNVASPFTEIQPATLELSWLVKALVVNNTLPMQWRVTNSAKQKLDISWNIGSYGRPRYRFFVPKRNKVFRREIIRRKF